jgi:crotonobetainyl-CoA:carnitine CoA-transferase CaiB-like acyl-CoA transferase
MSAGPLAGVRVLELGQVISAPFCARLFADFGADVIKVEPPQGDLARSWGPFPGDRPDPEASGIYLALNTNKRGVTINLDHERGRQLFLELVRWADILVHNHQPAQLERWRLTYDAVAEINPQVVMISITPFGSFGPYANWKGYDLNAYHLSAAGHRYLGKPDREPLAAGTFIADFYGGYVGAAWGFAAYYGRQVVGRGQHVDVSSAEAIAALFTGCQNIGGYAQDGIYERRTGGQFGIAAPAKILRAKDGYVWVMALTPRQWQGLVNAMGNPDWAQLDIFSDMFRRAQHADALYPLMELWTQEHPKEEIMNVCQANLCPTTAVYTVQEAVEHPHMRVRNFIREVEHEELGRVRVLGPIARLSSCDDSAIRPAPRLGQHNAEVFGGLLGLSASSIDELRSQGAI